MTAIETAWYIAKNFIDTCKVDVFDKTWLDKCTPDRVTRFLEANGWTKKPHPDGVSRWLYFTRQGGNWIEMPAYSHYADYHRRMAEQIRLLSEKTGKTQLSLVFDIAHS